MTDRHQKFNSYWENVTDDVEALVEHEVDIQELPLRSNEVSTAYSVRFSGLGKYPLFAYLTVPKGTGPFPALMLAPEYGSVVSIPAYERRAVFVVLALCHRGQRHSDKPYSAQYPGLLTDGLPKASTYRWRDIVADCLRAVDILFAQPTVDPSRLLVVGNDLAFITAALKPKIRQILITSLLFRGTSDQIGELKRYPLQEFTDYIQAYPAQREHVAQTLTLFDPLNFAERIEAKTLITCMANQRLLVEPLVKAIPGDVELRINTGRSFLDHQYQERWLSQCL